MGLTWEKLTETDDTKINFYAREDEPLQVTIDGQFDRQTGRRKELTKTWRSTRTIILPSKARKIFQTLHYENIQKRKLLGVESLVPPPEAPIFSKDGVQFIRQQADNARWRKLLEENGLPRIRGDFQRHTAATIIARTGISSTVAARFFGWSSEDMLEYYSHIDSKASAEVSEQLYLNFNLVDKNGDRIPREQVPRSRQDRFFDRQLASGLAPADLDRIKANGLLDGAVEILLRHRAALFKEALDALSADATVYKNTPLTDGDTGATLQSYYRETIRGLEALLDLYENPMLRTVLEGRQTPQSE